MKENINIKKILIITVSLSTLITITLFTLFLLIPKRTDPIPDLPKPTNIILLIGDGMGTEHLKLIERYKNKLESGYSIENCPNTLINTNSATQDSPTDSAAGATAIATGVKVLNGTLSMEIPGSKRSLTTILEILKERGYSTGLVTTTEITHATPAAFASHTESRNNEDEILQNYFKIQPDLIFGGLNKKYTEYETEDYTIVTNKKDLEAINSIPSLGVFGTGGHIEYVQERTETTPSLLEMTKKATALLNKKDKSFFLMVEGGRIDHASHSNNEEKTLYELEEFMNVVEYLYDWSLSNTNTILIITADHETGGLEVISNIPNEIPKVSWKTTGHTSNKVPLYICFDNNIDISAIEENTDIFKYMRTL